MDNNLHNKPAPGIWGDYPGSHDSAILRLRPVFEIGSPVYVVTDPDQNKRIVTGYEIRDGGRVLYLVSYMQHEFTFADYELSAEVDKNIKMGI